MVVRLSGPVSLFKTGGPDSVGGGQSGGAVEGVPPPLRTENEALRVEKKPGEYRDQSNRSHKERTTRETRGEGKQLTTRE